VKDKSKRQKWWNSLNPEQQQSQIEKWQEKKRLKNYHKLFRGTNKAYEHEEERMPLFAGSV
jgi:hypothetical protein